MMKQSWIALIIGYILDLILGDPHSWWHPVQGIGYIITKTEKTLRKIFPKNEKSERIAGGILVCIVLTVSVGVPALLLYGVGRIHPAFGILVESLFCYQLLATKSLKDESMNVYRALKQNGLQAGREAVSMIVGRDTAALTEEGVVKAAVETVAENTSDGIIAPMFYMAIGGGVLGFFYKAVNTMDSMIGYKNDTYRNFGTCAARLDDLVNYLPARLSAGLMLLASVICRYDGKQAVKVYWRDRRNHKSPNAAQTEAVMAGALRVQLAGNAWYFGKLVEKPTIGDALRPVEMEDIVRADQLLYMTSFLGMILMTGIKYLLLMG